MIDLAKRKKPLTVTSADSVRECGKIREVVLDCQPHFALVRLKGTRTSFPISYAAIYHAAARIEAEKQHAEKKARRPKR